MKRPDFERYAEAVRRHRLLLLGAIAVILGLAVTGFEKLEYDTTYRIWFEEESPQLAEYDELLARFGSDDTALIVLTDDASLVSNDALASIQALTDALWKIDGVKRVDAVTNFSIARASRIQHESAALVVTDDYAAAAGDKNDIFVFGEETFRLEGHSGTIEHLAASPSALYSAGLDRTIRAWDLDTHESRFALREHAETISSLVYDAGRLYVGTRGDLRVFDAIGGRRLLKIDVEGFVTDIFVDEQTLIVVADEVVFADARTGNVRQRSKAPQPALDATYFDGVVYTAHENGTVMAYDLESSTRRYKTEAPIISVAHDGNRLVLGTGDGAVHTVDDDGPARIERTHEDWVTDVLVDGDRIISASLDRDVVIRTADGVVRLQTHRASVRRLAVHGTALYTLGDDGDLYIFDRRTSQMVARHRRAAAPNVIEVSPLIGPERATLRIDNGFRRAVDVRVGGASVGTVLPGAIGQFDGLKIAEESSCEDDPCGPAQYCDYERDEPTCTTVAAVELFDHSGVRLAATEAFLRPNVATQVEVPSDDAFSVSEAVAVPIDPRMFTSRFVETFPTTRDVVIEIAGPAFIAPDAASSIAERLESENVPLEAIEWASTLAQVELSPLALPMQPRRLAELRHHLTKKPDEAGVHSVLNRALDTSLVVVAVHQPSDDGALERSKRVTADLRAVIDDARTTSDFDIHLTGGIVQETVMEEYAQRGISRILPMFFGVLALMLILVYRRPAGLLVPLGLVVTSIAFSMGVAGHLGASLNNMTVVGPQVVLAACIGDAVHLFNSYTDRLRLGASVRDATKFAFVENFMPCFWTSASTSLGFFSLCTSRVVPVATFGWIAGIGVLTAFVLSFTLMPAVMSMLPAPRSFRDKTTGGFDRWIDGALTRFAHAVNANTTKILTVGAVALVVAAYGLTGLRFETSELGAFKEGAPIRVATDLLEQRELSGAYGLHLMVDTKEEKGIRKVEHLAALESLEAHLAETEALMTIVGVTDIHRRMNRVMHQDQPAYHRIPGTDREASAHYDAYTFSLRSGMNLTHRVSADESATLIDLRFTNQESSWFLAWGDSLRDWARTNVPSLDVTITGKSWLVTNTVTEIAVGFVKNVGSAVLVISLLVLLAAGSVRIGMPACIANVIPVGATLGLISLAGKSMDISAIVACCVAMGIIVDDTLHFMSHYASAISAGTTHDAAVVEAVRHSGKAMLFTTAILVVGFLMFAMADYTVTVNFGLMSATMLFFGLVFDLTLLPAGLRLAVGLERRWARRAARKTPPARAGSGVW